MEHIHPNTRWLMDWNTRMFQKWGNPPSGYDWCRELAYHVGEQGNDYPSNDAIHVAEEWEDSGYTAKED